MAELLDQLSLWLNTEDLNAGTKLVLTWLVIDSVDGRYQPPPGVTVLQSLAARTGEPVNTCKKHLSTIRARGLASFSRYCVRFAETAGGPETPETAGGPGAPETAGGPLDRGRSLARASEFSSLNSDQIEESDARAHARARVGGSKVGIPPERPILNLDEKISRAINTHPEAGAVEALRDDWCRDLAVLVVELSLTADVVTRVLDGWVIDRNGLRDSGRLDATIRERKFPALREVWWSRHRDWLLRKLEVVRGQAAAPARRSAVLDLDPCEVPK